MAADIKSAQPAPKHRCLLRFHSSRRSLIVVGMATTVLAISAWSSRTWNRMYAMDDTTASPRSTMIGFQVMYTKFMQLRDLPFPVRNAPVRDRPGRVNGDGKALYSWRAEISDLLWDWAVDWDERQAWDSPVNRGLMWRDRYFAADNMLYQTEDSVRRQKSFPQTIIMAIVGPGTAFGDNKKQTRLKGLPPNAVLLVESRASGIPWPAPGDFDVRTMPHTINAKNEKGISGQNPGGFVVLFADGQAWFMSEKIPFETLEKFFTIEGAKKHDREKLLGPFALKRLKYGENKPTH